MQYVAWVSGQCRRVSTVRLSRMNAVALSAELVVGGPQGQVRGDDGGVERFEHDRAVMADADEGARPRWNTANLAAARHSRGESKLQLALRLSNASWNSCRVGGLPRCFLVDL